MHDYKHNLKGRKSPKVKLNRRKEEKKPPRDWRRLLLRLLRVSLFAGGAALVVVVTMLGIQFMRESSGGSVPRRSPLRRKSGSG